MTPEARLMAEIIQGDERSAEIVRRSRERLARRFGCAACNADRGEECRPWCIGQAAEDES